MTFPFVMFNFGLQPIENAIEPTEGVSAFVVEFCQLIPDKCYFLAPAFGVMQGLAPIARASRVANWFFPLHVFGGGAKKQRREPSGRWQRQ